MQVSFGVGYITFTPLVDASGNAIAVPTPVQAGIAQSFSLDAKWETKEVMGPQQFAKFVARGKGSISGKFETATLNAAIIGMAFGGTLTNSIQATTETVATAIPATPFTITVTPPSSGVFAENQGVLDVTTGREMTKVASAPATGQYSHTAGAYLFAAADTGKSVIIRYSYTAASTSAKKIAVDNVLQGTTPTFSLDWSMPFQGKIATLRLPSITLTDFSFGAKNGEVTIPSMGYMAMESPTTGRVIEILTSE